MVMEPTPTPAGVAQPTTDAKDWAKEYARTHPNLVIMPPPQVPPPSGTPQNSQPKVSLPGASTLAEKEEAILRVALADLGIHLDEPEFQGFLKELHGAYTEAHDVRKNYGGTWEQFVNQLALKPVQGAQYSDVTGGMEPLPLPLPQQPSGLQQSLDGWREAQETARREAQELRDRQAAAGRREGAYQKQRSLQEAEFKDALADLKRRYPKNKNVIDALADSAFKAWQDTNDRTRQDFAGIPPEVRETQGMWQVPSIDAGAFARSLDWGAFADSQGLGDAWQGGLFRQAFDTQIAEPLRVAAKTPAQKLAVESQIAQLESASGPALQQRFQIARQDAPNLDMDTFLGSDEAKGILNESWNQYQQRTAMRQQQRNQVLARQSEALAAKGYSLEERAGLLGVNVNELVAASPTSPATALRQMNVNAATQALPGAAAGVSPADAARMIAYGQANIGARDAALNAIPGYAEAARAANIRESQFYTQEANRQAQAATLSNLRLQAANLYAAYYGAHTDASGNPVAVVNQAMNEGELQNYINQMRPLVAKKQQEEAYQAAVKPDVDKMLADKAFAPELDRYVAQNRKVTMPGTVSTPEGDVYTSPDVYETYDQVVKRATPDLLNQYQSFRVQQQRSQNALARSPLGGAGVI